MPTWILYAFGAVFIVAVVSGGYLYIQAKDNRIHTLEQTITNLEIDKANLTSAYNSQVELNKKQAYALRESNAQAIRLKQGDAAERQRQADFDRQVQGINVRDAQNLDRINSYQACVARDVNNTECSKIL
jgi:hypothetical protein